MLSLPALTRRIAVPAVLSVLLALLSACSSGGDPQPASFDSGITVETVTPVVVQPTQPPKVTEVANTVTPTAQATQASASTQTPDTDAPTAGKWIDVDVTRFQVRLMNGTQALQTIAPIAVGEEVNTGAYESTQTGLFHVYNKIGGLQYDAPYDAYISDWVAFDPAKDNGFHSFLLDESGDVVDPSTGRVSNGCIRTDAAKEIYDFAEVGMAVYVHL